MITRTLPVPQRAFREGIDKCIENADELLRSAKSLMDKSHYPACTFLAIQASEECGKALLLVDEIISDSPYISRTRWRQIYCNHEAKLKRARKGIQDIVYKITNFKATISMNGRIGEEIPEEETIEDLTKFTLKSKIESLYVDYGIIGGTDRWVSPQDDIDIIGEIDSKGAISLAENTRIALMNTIRDLGL